MIISISLGLSILIEGALLAWVISNRIIEAELFGSYQLRLICCFSVKRLLSSLKSCNRLVDFLLGSVRICRKILCLLYSVIVGFALLRSRVLVGWVGSLELLVRIGLSCIARVYLTMLSNGSVKLIFASGKVVKLFARSIKLSLGFVNSLLRGVLVVLYLISFSKRFIISLLCFFSSIILSVIWLAISCLKVRVVYVLIPVSSYRTRSCSSSALAALPLASIEAFSLSLLVSGPSSSARALLRLIVALSI